MTKLEIPLGSLIVDNSHPDDVSVVVGKSEERFQYRLMFLGPKKLSTHWFHARYVEHFCSVLTLEKLAALREKKKHLMEQEEEYQKSVYGEYWRDDDYDDKYK